MRRTHILGKEENQSKLYGVRGDNGCVLTLAIHGEVTCYSTASYQGGRCRGRRSGDLQGFVPTYFDVGGVPCKEFSGKGKHSRKIEGAFNVSTLEVKSGYNAEENGTATTV